MNKFLSFLCFLSLCACTKAQEPNIIEKFPLKTVAGFRGISAVSDNICWFSGAEGQVYRVEAASKKLIDCSPSDYGKSDFRDIHAFSVSKAIILSAGLPALILLTEDGGETWQEVYRNETEGIFFDALDFWDDQRGLAFSDAIGRALPIIETKDGGKTWQAIDPAIIPPSHLNQGGFAASGTSLKTYGDGQAIIGLGGKEATIYKTQDFLTYWLID